MTGKTYAVRPASAKAPAVKHQPSRRTIVHTAVRRDRPPATRLAAFRAHKIAHSTS